MTIKRVRNCTPHPVRILLGGGEFVFEPSGDLARIETDERCGDAFMGIPVSYVDYGRVSGLPDEEEDTALIVSQMVAQELEERDDLYFPIGLVRDEKTHKVLGAKGLGKIRRK